MYLNFTTKPVTSDGILAAAVFDVYALDVRYRDPVIGRFTSFDSFDGSSYSPLHLNKYLYSGSNPVMNTDPSGHDWSLGSVVLAAGIGAALGGISTVGINYALGRPLTSNLGLGIGIGAAAVPLSLLFPALGVGLAGFGLVSSVGVLSQVWLNPRSTWGQKGVSVALVVGAAFMTRSAYRGFQDNGWYNPAAFNSIRPTVGTPLSMNSTLSELMTGVPDNAMMHLSTASESALSQGTNPRTYWVRFGDVKNYTLPELRTFIGQLSEGGSQNANTAVVKLVNPGSATSFRPVGPRQEFWNVQEYMSDDVVVPDGTMVISKK